MAVARTGQCASESEFEFVRKFVREFEEETSDGRQEQDSGIICGGHAAR